MAFSDMIRANVDGRMVDIPADATPEDIVRAAGQNPNQRQLVMANEDGTTNIVPRKGRIKPVNGQRFETQLPADGGK